MLQSTTKTRNHLLAGAHRANIGLASRKNINFQINKPPIDQEEEKLGKIRKGKEKFRKNRDYRLEYTSQMGAPAPEPLEHPLPSRTPVEIIQ